MKKVNELTVYEENDKCALDEYSEQLAKDIHQKIRNEAYDDKEVRRLISTNTTSINAIKEEQTTQNQSIDQLNQDSESMRNDFNNAYDTVSGSGESVTLEDTMEARFKKIVVGGNTIQNGEPSIENIVDIRNCGENGNVNFKIRNKNLINTDILKGLITNNDAFEITGKNSFKIDLSKGKNLFNQHEDLFFGKLDGKQQYTLSYHTKQDNDTFRLSIAFVYKDGTLNPSHWKQEGDISIVSEKEIAGICIGWNTIVQGGVAEFTDIQLVLGNKKTEFIENQEQSFSFPTKEGQVLHKGDYLADDGVHHVRKTIELDGTERWDTMDTQNNEDTIYLVTEKYDKFFNRTDDIILCNIAKKGTVWNGTVGNVVAHHNNQYGRLRFRFYKKDFASIDDWKAYLSEQKEKGTPVVVECTLQEEVIEPYSPEQQQARDEIKRAMSYDGLTYIFSTDEISPVFEVEACKSLLSVIEQQRQEIDLLEKNTLHKTVNGEIITVNDSAEWGKNKLVPFGMMEQETRSGRNFYNVNDTHLVSPNNKVDSENWISSQYDNSNGENTSYLNYFTNPSEKIKPTTAYYVVIEVKNKTGDLKLVAVDGTNSQFSEAVIIGNEELKTGIYIRKITSKSSFEGVNNMLRTFVQYEAGKSGSITFRLSVLEEKPTEESFMYEPYGAKPSPEFKSDIQSLKGNLKFVKFGKNWLPYPYENDQLNKGIFKDNGDGSITIKGELTENFSVRIMNMLFLKTGSYRMSFGLGKLPNESYFNIKNPNLESYEVNGAKSDTSFTVDQEGKFNMTVVFMKGTYDTTLFSMLEKTNKAETSKWEPYSSTTNDFTLEEGQELCGMKTDDDTLANCIDENSEKWVCDYLAEDSIHKTWGEIVLDGTEKWSLQSVWSEAGENTNAFFFTHNITNMNRDSSNLCLYNVCSHFKFSQSYLKDNECFALTGNLIIRMSKKKAPDVETFKSFLAEEYANGTPVILKYLLAEETVIPYTETQKKQFKQLQSLFLQRGTNNIYCTNELAKHNSLTYMQDIQSLGDRMSALEAKLGEKEV